MVLPAPSPNEPTISYPKSCLGIFSPLHSSARSELGRERFTSPRGDGHYKRPKRSRRAMRAALPLQRLDLPFRLPENFLISFARGGGFTHFDYFEIVAFNPFEGLEFGVVPAGVGGTGDEPVAAVVCNDHAVALEGGQDDLGGRWEARGVVVGFEADADAHGGELGVVAATGPVAGGGGGV